MTSHSLTIGQALLELIRRPYECLILRWNWKAAIFSSLWRGGIFFTANLSSGLDAAAGAMYAEVIYRAATAGFYGAVTQQISRARPIWLASVAALIVLPLLAHSIELAIHWIRGTPNLARSVVVSVLFTGIATIFNVHAMSRGILTAGPGSKSVGSDLLALARCATRWPKRSRLSI